MMRAGRSMAALVALLFTGLAAASSADVSDILSKYTAWRGGPRFEALRSLHRRGTIRVGEADGRIEEWLVRDGRLRRDRSLGPVAESWAVTAHTAWTVNASGQVENLGDGGTADRRTVALAFADLGKTSRAMSYEAQGTEQAEGRTWAVIRVRFGGSDTYDLLLDPASGELLGERTTQDRAVRFVRYGDWRFVAGVRVAFEERETGSTPEATESKRFASVEVDSATAQSVFARPVVKRLSAFAPGRRSTGWISFDFFNDDQIFIPVRVNGRAVDVVLDTGADLTVLDKALASSLGVEAGGAVSIAGTGGQSTMQLARNIDVQIGNLTVHRITAAVMDMSALAGQLGRPLPMVLGKEVFNELIVDIDFPNRRIAFHEPASFTAPAGAIRVPLGRHGQNRTIPVSLEGREPVAFDFDLGSNSPLIVYPAYRDGAKLFEGRRHSLGLSGGVGGLFKPGCATFAFVSVGGLRLTDVPADFPDAADSAANSDRTSGNVGLPVFSRFRLMTDYSHDAAWLAATPASLAAPFRKNRSGLISIPAADRLNVMLVAPGSPAEQTGWKEGAQIVAVDGHAIDDEYRTSALSRWGYGQPGTHVRLTLADGTTQDLVLADYY